MDNPDISEDLCKFLLQAAARPQPISSQEGARPAQINGQKVVDFRENTLEINHLWNTDHLRTVFGSEALACAALNEADSAETSKEKAQHNRLRELGLLLVPFSSFGILNGGAATSYFDQEKNQSFTPCLMERTQDIFRKSRETYGHLPKGLCPAWFNPDGAAGPSFFDHKLEAVIRILAKSRDKWDASPFLHPHIGSLPQNAPAVFQMANQASQPILDQAATRFMQQSHIQNLLPEAGCSDQILTGIQELGAALSLSDTSPPKLFDHAWGKPGCLLPLPAGHGQALQVLKSSFKKLLAQGIRFASIGNIDNIAYTPFPEALALLALSGRPALFEFSYKTPMDVKGGILLEKPDSSLFCGDIGQAIPSSLVDTFEKDKKPILFNCASGLFNLEWLLEHVDQIYAGLPLRISEQKKQAGHYWQAEMNFWDSISLIPDAMIICVEKNRRFIPAKLFADTLLNSGIRTEKPYPTTNERMIWEHGEYLREGLNLLRS